MRKRIAIPETFWGNIARELDWFEPWTKVLEWDAPWAKWFIGGKLNLSHNCLDRHLATWRRNKAAIIWEGEPGEIRTLTYQQLLSRGLEIRQRAEVAGREEGRPGRDLYGDVAGTGRSRMLACARIGAPHTVIFGGFSSQALVDRINDAQCTCVITQDGTLRRGARSS